MILWQVRFKNETVKWNLILQLNNLSPYLNIRLKNYSMLEPCVRFHPTIFLPCALSHQWETCRIVMEERCLMMKFQDLRSFQIRSQIIKLDLWKPLRKMTRYVTRSTIWKLIHAVKHLWWLIVFCSFSSTNTNFLSLDNSNTKYAV